MMPFILDGDMLGFTAGGNTTVVRLYMSAEKLIASAHQLATPPFRRALQHRDGHLLLSLQVSPLRFAIISRSPS